ncbi:DUF2971 domain-containing protein [Clostridium sp. YIM B02569]|uniref:DUF2971 domain-containing protein n=1 Tax=Clostridium sp. YIM B02569 TaxID=2911967 RepID=UPI001EECB0C6|nr:DUF2971 domain-containing protein [Clostridium sp. YIM B02569]
MEKSTMYIDDLIKVPVCTYGDKIYHYTNAEGVKGIIENKEFWATKSDFLNDKLEFQYAREVVEELCKVCIKNIEIQSTFIKYASDEFDRLSDSKNGILSGYYVISFSKKQNSSLLWSEFSDFMGYCIEFDFKKLLLGIQKRESFFWHGSIIYNKEQQIECLREILMAIVKQFAEEERADLNEMFESNACISNDSLKMVAEHLAMFCCLYAMFFKKECFLGEEEYRFVFFALHEKNNNLDKIKTKMMKFREKNQFLIPYIIVEYKDDYDQIPVESILVGPKNNIDLAVKGIEYFLRKENIDIPVKKSDIPLRY